MQGWQDTKQMQHFLGVPALILVAMLGSLCCLLLAIGFCKATQLLRTPVLPDVIPKVGSQSCHCGQRVVARDSTVKANSCVIKIEGFHIAQTDKEDPALPSPKLETQREFPTLGHTTPQASETSLPGNPASGEIVKAEPLNKGYHRSFH